MFCSAHCADPDGEILGELLRCGEILPNLATVVHYATVKIVPVVADPLNWTVKLSPAFKVSADP